MSLASDFVKFKSSDKSAMIGDGISATTGISAVGKFVNSESRSSTPNYGVIIEVSGGHDTKSKDCNIGLKSNCNIIGKGVVGSCSLYEFSVPSGSSVTAINAFSSTILLKSATSEGVTTFPDLDVVRAQLGITNTRENFSTRLTLIANKVNSTTIKVVGIDYFTATQGTYPHLNEPGVTNKTTPVIHNKGDVSEWLLVYRWNASSLRGEYDAYRLNFYSSN
jgi:hypothetical protein